MLESALPHGAPDFSSAELGSAQLQLSACELCECFFKSRLGRGSISLASCPLIMARLEQVLGFLGSADSARDRVLQVT